MLNDAPRKQLAAMITLDGMRVTQDYKICESLLRDYCGEYRPEIAALVAAVRWGIPKALQEGGHIPTGALRANLARRLQENSGLAEDSAYWAVDSWSGVLCTTGAPPADAPVAKPVETPLAPFVPDSLFVPSPEGKAPAPQPPQPQPPPQVPPPQVSLPQVSPLPVSPPQMQMEMPFAAAARALENNEQTTALRQVEGYLKKELKKQSASALAGQMGAAGVDPHTAKKLLARIRRKSALRGMLASVSVFIIAVILAANRSTQIAADSNPMLIVAVLLFWLSALYGLYCLVRMVRTFL